jgi:hypothetical protein
VAKPKRRKTQQRWSLLGALGWEVWLPLEKDSGGATFPVIAWAWSQTEVRAVICGRKGPWMLTKAEQKEGQFRRVELR